MKFAAVSLLAVSFLAGCADDEAPKLDNEAPKGEGGAQVEDPEPEPEPEPEPDPEPEPSCEDGVQNLDETDIDCGGSCGACNIGEQCAAQQDCGAGVCFENSCTTVRSCKEARSMGADQDGVYTIDLGLGQVQDVYCDMTTDGGGWTLLTVVRDDDGTNGVNMVADQVCTSPDVDLACKGRMLTELISTETQVRVEDNASGDYVVYGGFSASAESALRYMSLELDITDDGVGSNITADPDLEVLAASGFTIDLADTQLRQWVLHGGWYVRADDVPSDVRISTTAYTTHDNKLFEHLSPTSAGSMVREGHQVLYYR